MFETQWIFMYLNFGFFYHCLFTTNRIQKPAQVDVAVKKPELHHLKSKPQELPQNCTAKKLQYAVLYLHKPQFAVWFSVLA